jgi:cation transport regulator
MATGVLCRVGGYAAGMPYESVEDLPQEQVDQDSEHGRRAFLEAFNSALETYDGDESRAFAVAHTAAKQADEKN